VLGDMVGGGEGVEEEEEGIEEEEPHLAEADIDE